MKAMRLALAQEDSWRNIAITLIEMMSRVGHVLRQRASCDTGVAKLRLGWS
jgi:hypothetical protein